MSNFERVRDFNRQFGLASFDEPQLNVFRENPKLLELRMNLIREEQRELEQAVATENFVEVIDALADIEYVVQGMADSLGINLDKAFDIVHASNMSKLCTDEEEAQRTVFWYIEQFREDKLPYDSPAYRNSPCGKYWVVFNKSTGKILKSINYHAADFSSLLEK